MINIYPIPAFTDNYIWALSSKAGNNIVVVDPGEAQPVLDYCHQHQCQVSGILVTHHHWDHSGGVVDLLNHFNDIPVYGSPRHGIAGVNHPVKENDDIEIAGLPMKFKVLEIPGHTLDHVAYVGDKILFCGDTLFSCGCGRVFEGTMEQMVNSLTKLKNLPHDTQMYCGHEYTLKNIQFAKMVDPDNDMLDLRQQEVEALRQQGRTSLPVSMGKELATNPFLRCDQKAIIQAVQDHGETDSTNPVTIFTLLRQWKDTF